MKEGDYYKKENIEGILQCTLAIPNKEVHIYFKNYDTKMVR